MSNHVEYLSGSTRETWRQLATDNNKAGRKCRKAGSWTALSKVWYDKGYDDVICYGYLWREGGGNIPITFTCHGTKEAIKNDIDSKSEAEFLEFLTFYNAALSLKAHEKNAPRITYLTPTTMTEFVAMYRTLSGKGKEIQGKKNAVVAKWYCDNYKEVSEFILAKHPALSDMEKKLLSLNPNSKDTIPVDEDTTEDNESETTTTE